MGSNRGLACFAALTLFASSGCDDGTDGTGGSQSTGTQSTGSQSTGTQSTSNSGSTGTGGPSSTWSLETGAFLVDLETANDGGLYVMGAGTAADLATKTPIMPDLTGPGYVAKLSATTGAVEWSYVLPGITPGPNRMVTSSTGHVAFDGHDAMTGLAVSLDATGKEAWKQASNNFGWTFPDFDAMDQVWAIQWRISATGVASHLSPIALFGAQVAESNLVYFGEASMGGPPELLAFELDGTTPVFAKVSTYAACNDCYPDLLAAALTTGEIILHGAVRTQAGLDPTGTIDWGCGQSGNSTLTGFSAAGDCLWSIPYTDLLPGRSVEPSAGATFLVYAKTGIELHSAADGSIVESWPYSANQYMASGSPYHPAVHVIEFVQGMRTIRRLK